MVKVSMTDKIWGNLFLLLLFTLTRLFNGSKRSMFWH